MAIKFAIVCDHCAKTGAIYDIPETKTSEIREMLRKDSDWVVVSVATGRPSSVDLCAECK